MSTLAEHASELGTACPSPAGLTAEHGCRAMMCVLALGYVVVLGMRGIVERALVPSFTLLLPGAIVLAAVLSCPRAYLARWLWTLFAAATFSALIVQRCSVELALGLASASVMTVALAYGLLGRLVSRPLVLAAPRDVVMLVAAGAVPGPALGAALAAALLARQGAGSYLDLYLSIWCGGLTGVLILVPALLCWQQPAARRASWLEALAVALVMLPLDAMVLSGHLPLLYLTMLPQLWAALRFAMTGAVLANLAFTLLVMFVMPASDGLLAQAADDSLMRLLLTQGLLAVTAVVTLLLGVTAARDTRQLAIMNARNAAIARERDAHSEALAASEERLLIALASTGAGLYDIDLVNRTARWDARVCELWGMPVGATPSVEEILNGLHQDDRAHVVAHFDQACAQRGDGHYQDSYRVISARDGEVRWVNVYGQFVYHGKRAVRIVGAVRDVSVRHASAAALRESENRLRAFLDNSNVVAWMRDAGGRYVYVSNNFLSRFELRAEDVLGKTCFDIWPAADARRGQDSDRAILADGRTREAIEETRHRQGYTMVWATNKFLFTNAAGERFVGGLGVDVTARHHAERALEDSEERFRNLVELSPDVILVLRQRRVEFVSAAAGPLLGITALTEIFDHPVHELIKPERHAILDMHLSRLESGAALPLTEEELVTRDGRVTPVEVVAVPFVDQRGPAILALLRDISLRRSMQALRSEAEARLHAFLRNPKVLAWMQDESGHYGFRSATFTRLSCGTDGDGKLCPWPRELALRLARDDRWVLSNECASETIEELVMSDGRVASWLLNRFPYRDATGRLHVGCIGIDISETRRLLVMRDELRTLSRYLQAAQEEERRHLAHELHDEFGSMLAVLRSQVKLLKSGAVAGADLGARVEAICAIVDSLLATTDRIVEGLRPPVLEYLGIIAAIERLVERYEANHALSCVLCLPHNEPDIGKDQALVLYRILQESLTNIAKHAFASRVVISLTNAFDFIELRVSDNGRGFAEPSGGRMGHGLIGMRERAGIVGGELHITSRAGAGTEVQVRLPRRNVAEG
jgi:PAS domain S-box-containing protein